MGIALAVGRRRDLAQRVVRGRLGFGGAGGAGGLVRVADRARQVVARQGAASRDGDGVEILRRLDRAAGEKDLQRQDVAAAVVGVGDGLVRPVGGRAVGVIL